MAGALRLNFLLSSRSSFSRILLHRRPLDPLLDGVTGAAPVRTGSIALNGEIRAALSAPVPSDLIFNVRLPREGMLVVDCGVAGPASTSVAFEATVTTAGAHAVRTCQVHAGPGSWKRVSLPLPRGPQVITLKAHVVGGEPPREALWGEPVVHWNKTLRELRRSTAFVLTAYGWRGTLRRLRARTAPDGEALYAAWFASHTPSGADLVRISAAAARLPFRPRIALLVGEGDTDAVARTSRSLYRQVYADWEIWSSAADATGLPDDSAAAARRHTFPVDCRGAAALNAALRLSSADFVATIEAGDELAPHALAEVATRVNLEPGLDVVYSDEDELTPSGMHQCPHFKPGWSPEHLQARMYLGRLLVVRRTAALHAGGYRAGFTDALEYDLVLRLADDHRVGHIARVLYHRAPGNHDATIASAPAAARAIASYWQARGTDVEVTPGAEPGVWRARHAIAPEPRVTVVIPTDGRPAPDGHGEALVVQCLRGLLDRTTYGNYEVLVADNGYLPEAATELLRHLPHRRLSYSVEPPFNFSHKLNFAVAHAAGPYVLLLNDDVEPVNPDWLSAMVEYAQQKPIGAVGAKLFYPDGRLQHAGVAVGVSGIAAHLLHQHPGGSRACDGIALAVRNCSAVTGACLLTRRSVYDEVGGFNTRLRIDFNDVDFCLRIRRAGYRIVFTPYARLYHHESASFGVRSQLASEVAEMRRLWPDVLEDDPYYNPNLSRDFADCRVRIPRVAGDA